MQPTIVTNNARIFNLLPGSWRFNRTLPTIGTVTGSAHFTEMQPGLLHYKETGAFTTQAQKCYQCQREYAYAYHPATDAIEVNFIENGKPTYLFHHLAFASNIPCQAHGEHRCNQDMYYVTYRFIDTDTFCIDYRVEGPTKNYTSNTVFQRQN